MRMPNCIDKQVKRKSDGTPSSAIISGLLSKDKKEASLSLSYVTALLNISISLSISISISDNDNLQMELSFDKLVIAAGGDSGEVLQIVRQLKFYPFKFYL